jgi:hypothetical protein
VDLTATNGALDAATSVTAINLSGAGGTNQLVANGAGGNITLANIGDSGTPAGLVIDGDQTVTVKDIILDGGGTNAISILANQDGTGGQSFDQTAGTAISTNNDTAAAVSITVSGNAGTAHANLESVSAGTTNGRVTVTVSSGQILDLDNDATAEITAAEALLIATHGIETAAANPLQLSVIRADINNSIAGSIFVTDIGTGAGLILTDLGGPNANAVSGVGGGGEIRASSPLTVSGNAITSGSMTYTAANSGVGDNLTVNNNSKVQDTTGTLTLNAGDDLNLNSGTTVESTLLVTLNFGTGNGGGQGDLAGTITSSSEVQVNAGDGGDTLNIFQSARLPDGPGLVFEGNAGNDATNVYFDSTHPHLNLAIHGGGGDADALGINATAGDDVYTIKDFDQTSSWKQLGGASYFTIIKNYATLENMTVSTTTGSDAVTFEAHTAPTGLRKVTVNGGGDSTLDGFKVVGTSATHVLTPAEVSAVSPSGVVFDDTVIVDDVGLGSGLANGSIPSFEVAGLGRLQLIGRAGNNKLVNNTGVKSFLVAEGGRDLLASGTNADYLVGGGGKDWLWGGAGADFFLPDYAYTAPGTPDTATKPYGSVTPVGGNKNGDQVDGDRGFYDAANTLNVRKGGIDTAAYSGVDSLRRVEVVNGKGGRITPSMWLKLIRINAKAVAKSIKAMLESDIVKPFPKGPDPQPAMRASQSWASIAAVAASGPSAATASAPAKGPVQGPQREVDAALMAFLASDFPSGTFRRKK